MYKNVVCVFVLVSCFVKPSCSNSDNIALLASTLKTLQRAACDNETVALNCPRGTSISIQVAQYGKKPGSHTCQVERPEPLGGDGGDDRCMWPNSMQYSLLQTVVEACQKKPQCKFSTQPKVGLVDPCPQTRKFVEVAYKCRPYEFRIRSVCENEVIKLSCNPNSRVAIYDAQYGRTAHESITCPQTQGVHDKTCLATHAVETVMRMCHGKRWCQVKASSGTFGSPCEHGSRTYLKIVYTCVPLGVLTKRMESSAEGDEVLNKHKESHDDRGLFDETEGAGERYAEPTAVSPERALYNPEFQTPKKEKEYVENDDISNESPTILTMNQDQSGSNSSLLIYIGIGVLIFCILIILLIGVRCYIIRRNSKRTKAIDMYTTDAPKVFNDDVSDIDNDIDVSHISGTFYEHPDMILYRDMPGHKGTIRAMRPMSTIYPCAGASMYGHVDFVPEDTGRYQSDVKDIKVDSDTIVSPKSLGRLQDSQFYYG